MSINVGGANMKILDGTQLRSLHVSLPPVATLPAPQVLELAESEVASSLFNLATLPLNLKSSALARLNNVHHVTSQLTQDAAAALIQDYLSAIADVLKDDPMVVSVLDGSSLTLFLEDEDDFAMLAENLFTELDKEDKGKIGKGAVKEALLQMGVEMGIPPFEEFPLLNEILKKRGAEGEGELGQSQFAELLQPILQDVADSLAEKHVIVIHNVKIADGSKLRQILSDAKQMDNIVVRILAQNHCIKEGQRGTEIIREFFEKNGKELGLPPIEAGEAVVSLYDEAFADIDDEKHAVDQEDDLRELVKELINKMAEQLDADPVFFDLDG